MVSPHVDLEQLLSSDPETVRHDAVRAWGELRESRPVVLHGAGGLGRRALRAMRARGDAPIAFADNGSGGRGEAIDGIPILTPEEAVREHPGAVFVITIWGANSTHRQEHSQEQLRTLGAERVCSFPVFSWHYSTSLPHYLIDFPDAPLRRSADVRRAFELFTDEPSRREFVEQLRLRVTGRFESLSGPVKHAQYFPTDLVEWRDGEVIFDGGAFDGDSLRAWLAWRGTDFARWIAIEPDPLNRERLESFVATLPSIVSERVSLHGVALASEEGRTQLQVTGTAASTVAAAEDDTSIATSLCRADSLDVYEPVSLFKLDIEGAELDALAGARKMITRGRPVLAIAAYHAQDHLWRVRLACSRVLDRCDLFLRPHNEEGWDLICYAIPRERRRSS